MNRPATILFLTTTLLAPALVWANAPAGEAPADAAPDDGAKATPEATLDAAKLPAGSELRAVAEELQRALSGLQLPDQPKPHFVEMRLARGEFLSIDASYGGLVTDEVDRQAVGTVDLRVGSRESDNSGYFGEGGGFVFDIPLQPDAAATRKTAWLALDRTYRNSVTALDAREVALAQLASDPPPSGQSKGPGAVLDLQWGEGDAKPERMEVDRKALAALVTALSKRFENHPTIDNGDVLLIVSRTYETVINTDGVVVGQMQDRAVLAVVADTRAEDGMHLDHGAAIHFQGLPKADDELRVRAEAMVDQVLVELEQLAAAPMLEEDYDGPVLFETEAAAQLLASTLAVHTSGNPAPLSDYGRVVELEPFLQERLGKTVMPEWIDVIDDPTLAGGFGSYARDGQGFKADKLTLVNKGVLSDLLMTRSRHDVIEGSNGRARMTPSMQASPSISNLEVVARKRGLDRKAMERELLRRAKEDGYEHAFVVTTLRDGSVLGPVLRDTAAVFGSGRKVSLPLPLLVFRLDADGKRTLVRGAILGPASMRVLRRIRAVGKQSQVTKLRLRPGISGGFAADLGVGAMLTETVDVQIDTPALLVDGLEIIVERGEHERLPYLVHPLRE